MPVKHLTPAHTRQEIIETYWNVNYKIDDKGTQEKIRNNRNILECKWYTTCCTRTVYYKLYMSF